MLTQWLSAKEKDNLPPYACFYIGASINYEGGVLQFLFTGRSYVDVGVCQMERSDGCEEGEKERSIKE